MKEKTTKASDGPGLKWSSSSSSFFAIGADGMVSRCLVVVELSTGGRVSASGTNCLACCVPGWRQRGVLYEAQRCTVKLHSKVHSPHLSAPRSHCNPVRDN